MLRVSHGCRLVVWYSRLGKGPSQGDSSFELAVCFRAYTLSFTVVKSLARRRRFWLIRSCRVLQRAKKQVSNQEGHIQEHVSAEGKSKSRVIGSSRQYLQWCT